MPESRAVEHVINKAKSVAYEQGLIDGAKLSMGLPGGQVGLIQAINKASDAYESKLQEKESRDDD